MLIRSPGQLRRITWGSHQASPQDAMDSENENTRAALDAIDEAIAEAERKTE